MLSRPICRSTGASLVGGSNIPLASKGGRVGMIDQAMETGSPSVNARVWWVFHSVDLQVEEGGRVALGGLMNVRS